MDIDKKTLLKEKRKPLNFPKILQLDYLFFSKPFASTPFPVTTLKELLRMAVGGWLSNISVPIEWIFKKPKKLSRFPFPRLLLL